MIPRFSTFSLPWILAVMGLGLFLWIPVNQDMIWLVHCAQKWMAGGQPFSVDFEELNPPFNVALYLPLAWLVNHSPLPAATTLSLAVWGVMVGIYLLVSQLLQQQEKEGFLATTAAHSLHIAVAVALFLVPAPEWGQREHFLLAFTLPYLVMTMGRVSGMTYSLKQQLPLAFLAGVGFIIKPYALMVPLLVEGLIAFQKRRFWALFNPTSLMMAAVYLVYGVWIYVVFPDYITFYVTLLTEVYGSFGIDNNRVLLGGLFILSVSVLLGALALEAIKEKTFRIHHGFWLIACAGFMASVLWQGKFFLYHLLPFLGVAFVFLGSFEKSQKERLLLLVLATSLFFYVNCSNLFSLNLITNTVWGHLKDETSVRRVTVLSRQALLPASLLDDPSLVYGSRYMSSWFAQWVLNQRGNKTLGGGHHPYESHFLNAVGEDMVHYKPQLIILENSGKDQPLLTWLRQNPSFQKEWDEFVPLSVDFGEFNDFFLFYIHRDVRDPEEVARALEKAIGEFSP
jgi:hypothetical protein